MTLASVLERSQQNHESWKYTDVKALLAAPFTPVSNAARKRTIEKAQLPSIVREAAQRHQIVFVKGVWQPELSRLGELPLDIMEGDATGGYRLKLEGKTCLITVPIELIFLDNPVASSIAMQGFSKIDAEISTKLFIEIGESGRLTLIEHHMYEIDANITRMVDTEIYLGPQAKLVHGKIVHGSMAAHYTTTRVQVAKGAYYDNFKLAMGGRLLRDEIDVTLAGPLAQCNLNGIMLLRGQEHADTTTCVTHAAPHGTSSELYKSVISGKAHGVFQGKILVRKGAQKTDGSQLSRALLLSDQAEMDAKPELEIYADDVKCSHGTTVGDLDTDMMFYLRARGLPETEARALLVRGFVDEVVDLISVPEWRAFCHKEIEEWLHEEG